MTDLTKLALAALGAAFLSGCAPSAPEVMESSTVSAADLDLIGDRFSAYFKERCAVPLRAGAAPDTIGLVPASDVITASYPKVPEYREFSGRDLSFWTAPDDPKGSVILVIENGVAGRRCAAVTRAFTAEQFAQLVKATYPEYVGATSDENVVNARAFLDDAADDELSLVYSSYHDDKTRISAGVVSLSETD
ncbi:hypothetical protein [Pikeienuella sp. HZG-20]|uniref:hypothetical protein n=1 Tax=Paludibacillus litoralis TaxID=3133267 RepID=UPI0030EC9ECC